MLTIALLHYPILNKRGDVVTTSLTNFDVHDIARASATYGVARYYVVTPVEMQRRFMRRIVAHWREGFGAAYNPSRKEALMSIEAARDLTEVNAGIERDFGEAPTWVATSARSHVGGIRCADLRRRLGEGEHVCLLFGTGYGLHPDIIAQADATLEPIHGPTAFNHLSVRSAVSIYLDRLLAPDRG